LTPENNGSAVRTGSRRTNPGPIAPQPSERLYISVGIEHYTFLHPGCCFERGEPFLRHRGVRSIWRSHRRHLVRNALPQEAEPRWNLLDSGFPRWRQPIDLVRDFYAVDLGLDHLEHGTQHSLRNFLKQWAFLNPRRRSGFISHQEHDCEIAKSAVRVPSSLRSWRIVADALIVALQAGAPIGSRFPVPLSGSYRTGPARVSPLNASGSCAAVHRTHPARMASITTRVAAGICR